MYLSKLEMVGFKSFAQKTELTFTDGVTSIVGPNGCGKSNIVDAIRWVLGEQKSSTLRADSMDQVIFNGSKTRKPLGMAEVSLTIENNRQILPTEYSQVVITRRLFRSGESQYLLNKTQCRLRDIVDLFMDTGMGSDAYSVIELKMIETILSDKADERRHLFEEAAGVTKYKARRREAQRKLDGAQRDIARVQDIVREVQKTVNSLARQADKARQHQELSTRLRERERLLVAFEYAQEYVVLKQWESRIAETRLRREALELALADDERQTADGEATLQEQDRQLRAAMEAESTLRTALGEVQQQISVLEERAAAAVRALDRLQREHHESASQAISTEEELLRVRLRLEQAQVDHQRARTEAEQRATAARTAQETLQAARGATAQGRDALTAARQTLADHRNAVDRLRYQAEGLQRRLRDNEAQQVQAEDRRRQVHDQIQQEQSAMPALDEALTLAEQQLQAAEQRQHDLRAEQEGLQHEADDVRARHAHTRASLEFLVGLVDTTESSKFLLNTAEWTPKGDKLTLAEVLNTDERFRIAVEASLGDAARYFVVDTRDEALQGIAALSRNAVGKATFLCRERSPRLAPPPPLEAIEGVEGWVSDLVRCDDALLGAVRSILGNTVVTTTLDDAWRALERSTVIDAAVTLAGELVHRAGAVRGGSASKTDGVRVGRRERIEQLTLEIAELEERVAAIDARLRAIKEELATIDLRRLGDDVRRSALVRNDRLQKIDNLRGRIDDIDGQRDTLHDEAERLQNELRNLAERSVESEQALAAASDAIAVLEQDVAGAQEYLAEAEYEYNECTADARRAELEAVRLHGELQTLASDEQRLSSQSLSLDQRQEQREREREDLVVQRDTCTTECDHMRGQADKLVARLAEARATREHGELSVREAQAAVQAGAEIIRVRRRDMDAATEAVHEADLRFNEVRIRVEALVRRATEELEMTLDGEPVVPESDVPPEQVRTDVQDLRRKLTSMGNVNFLALEEHEREAERLLFLTAQLDDLVNSERTLQQTIAEINQTAREKFTTTFVRIRENFITLFKVLFTEDDEADLQMTDDEDPLECTIEIQAKPRGKRPHSIEMLSGGEKTLTAIALLFAIYLVKPSPFCILDEVDAPLDDANIDRYLKIIRKFSENTQFLMITHNKKTMEAADTLYGVTMEEPAVSKTVSVRLSGEPSNKKSAA